MPEKIRIPARADEELINQVKAVADKQGWSFQAAMEIAMKRFVNVYEQLDLPNIGLDDSTPPRQVVVRGVTYSQIDLPEAA